MTSPSPTATASAAIEISEVSIDKQHELILGNLERPVADEPMEGLCIPLSGWALAHNGEKLDIQIDTGREVLLRSTRRVHRPDIAAAFPNLDGSEESGFSLVLSAVRLPRQFALRVVAGGQDFMAPLARIHGTRQSFEPVSDLSLAPLNVTTLGRTGSTLMLTLLSLHPAIAAFRPVGYDSRPLAYWMDAVTTFAAPSSRMQLLQSTAEGPGWWLGHEPLSVQDLQRLERPIRELLVGSQPKSMLQLGLRRATEFARQLALADGNRRVRYTAEKCTPGYLPELLHELCDEAKEIFLVRDFRDVFTSMLAFNAKRGYAAFGREYASDDHEFLKRLTADVDALASSWVERRDRALVVRYEELVEDPASSLEKVFEYLGLETSRPEVDAIVTDAYELLETTLRQHRTTPEATASQGRWLRDLEPPLQQACTEAFEDALREFGYL